MRSSTVTTALSSNEIDARLRKLGDWKLDAGKLVRTFEFPDFRASLVFVNAVGDLAEEAAHHPDMDIRYNKVHLELVTHDAGGITARDFELAEAISRLQ
jgi:4a-hydroxytetrahydrobiopterin dehydratase